MDVFLHQVVRAWYRLFYTYMLAINLIVVGASFAVVLVPSLQHLGTTWGVSLGALILAGIAALYCLTVYWVVKQRSWSLAAFFSGILTIPMLCNGMTQTYLDAHSIPYVAVWLSIAALVGMFGLPLSLCLVFLTSLYVLVQNGFELSQASTMSWILLGGTLVVTLGAYYLFWRRQYIGQQPQVNQLAGMLRTNQQQSAILIQSLADGVIVINGAGKISLINPSAAAMTEWSVAEATGIDAPLVAKFAHENGETLPDNENPFAVALHQRQRMNQILLLKGRKGKQQITSLVISPVLVPQTGELAGAIAVLRDVSDQRAAEQQRADFISTAAHEMRTPVAAIEGYLALALNEKVSSIDARARAYLNKAHASTQHLGKLFQDLLTSSKAEDGRLSNHPTVVEMGAFLQQLTDDLKLAAQKKGLFVEFLVGSTEQTIDATTESTTGSRMVRPLYYVHVDADRMREVITNLFDNACKYTEQGKISIGLTGNKEVVQVYVRDTGVGIPAEDVGHLFQKFYRVDNSATRIIGGTGLGLFICRKIVELYQGHIWVESELGKGSTFFINLPRLDTQKASQLQASEAVPPTAAAGAPASQSAR